MRHWLMKSEPGVYSIEDLRRDGRTSWEGVRNYQARNFMRDGMNVGDLVLFYHSNAEPAGVAGLGRIVRVAYPDPFATEPGHPYFDEKAKPDTWVTVDVGFVEGWKEVVSLAELKADPALAGMEVTRRGSRLSVQPVCKEHHDRVVALGHSKGVA